LSAKDVDTNGFRRKRKFVNVLNVNLLGGIRKEGKMPKKIKFDEGEIKNILDWYSQGYSKLEIGKKLSVNCCVIKRVLNEQNIQERTLKEQNKTLITQNNAKKTNLQRLGVELIKQKKEKIFLQRYGVKTNLQRKDIREKAVFAQQSDIFKEKMRKKILLDNPIKNPLYLQKMRETNKKRLAKLSSEELRRLTLSARKNIKSPSKPELRVKSILKNDGIPFKHHFFLEGYSYDFKIKNLLLEIQGDYWHLNPKRYQKNYQLFGKKAEDIWKKDTLKKELAEKEGYNISQIWESELNSMNNNQVLDFIKAQI
jgi:hypothetical protein